ncbi:hypothetical protein [Duganella sp. Root198D2]|uniref:hypothetical protein n=1 Tax=Duganella sp. Root198D2 TaxID=1736489 RepID=UPI00070A7B7B|nr:hypothetical protein [Duganella sp. Root198D2]KRB92538.1 hypothetical protein ASE26_06135 [Duganella sp. Root198D2]
MSKHQIFLVHGMGNFERGWSDGVKQLLLQKFGAYKALANDNYAGSFEFKEIVYGDVFESWRQQWKDDAAKAAKAMTDVGLSGGLSGKLVSLANSTSGNSFFQTHVLDVIMYRYLMPLTESVRRSIQSQVLGHLNSFPAYHLPRYSVIAHSLGAAVMYESFHAMMTDPQGLPLTFRPQNYFAVANVVRPLWNRGGTCYPSEMGPALSDDEGLCYRFGNYSHALDPFTAFMPFDPPEEGWFSPRAPKAAVYHNVRLPVEDLHDFNVHSFEHYVDHPDVHVPMLRALTGFEDLVTQAEHQKALTDWRKKSLKGKARDTAIDALRQLLVRNEAHYGKHVDALLAFRDIVLAQGKADGES